MSAVPEPETWALMLAGLGPVGATAARRPPPTTSHPRRTALETSPASSPAPASP
ncbi:MAG TPA: PEPxxWA-CTERM sorting domain-containing protein [Burkholderiaceae bacterium]|nr:PEPxxWA-CTERM sorting domain-containing protein [Burkholderiaceae bacterium]